MVGSEYIVTASASAYPIATASAYPIATNSHKILALHYYFVDRSIYVLLDKRRIHGDRSRPDPHGNTGEDKQSA